VSTRLMAYIAFGCEQDYDADGAATRFEQAGYEVHRLPEKYRRQLEFPGDDHMEVVITGRDEDAVMAEVCAIADKFGGNCIECGPIDAGYEPFVDLFKPILQSH